MVPADDQAIVLPCASVMVIMVLLNVAFTCATPEAMFLRSRLRTRVASLPILDSFRGPAPNLSRALQLLLGRLETVSLEPCPSSNFMRRFDSRVAGAET